MTISELNGLEPTSALAELNKCCGSARWAESTLKMRPFEKLEDLLFASDKAWSSCTVNDQLEAFSHHPKIGDVKSLQEKFATTKHWAGKEQSGVAEASTKVIERLAELNTLYEDRFGFIFIICASGQTANAMLAALEQRVQNNYDEELRIAAAEQHKITDIRLKKMIP